MEEKWVFIFPIHHQNPNLDVGARRNFYAGKINLKISLNVFGKKEVKDYP